MGEFLTRQPFSILGAISVLSIVSNLVTLSDDIVVLLDAWREIVRPVAEFLFGWVAEIFGFDLPVLAKDYLVVGLVSFGASIRQSLAGFDDFIEALPMAVAAVFAWPIVSVIMIFRMLDFPEDGYVFLETYVYALILLGLAFAWTSLA